MKNSSFNIQPDVTICGLSDASLGVLLTIVGE